MKRDSFHLQIWGAKMRLMAIILFVFPILGYSACRVEAPYVIFNTASINEQVTYSYISKGSQLLKNPRIEVSDCSAEAAGRKYLMVGVGADYYGPNADSASVAYTGKLVPDQSLLMNSFFEDVVEFPEREKHYQEQTEFINRCVNVIIRHAGSRSLRISANEYCQIEQVDANTVHMRGGFCFFSIFPDSAFELMTQIRPECTDVNYLQEFGINPMEVWGHINLFVAGNDSGLGQDLTPLKSVGAKFTLEAPDELLSLSENLGPEYPRWPGIWQIKDIGLGTPEIKQIGSNASMKVPFLVDNRCVRKCRDGLCSSNCSYGLPVSAEIRLAQLHGKKEELLLSWYDGGTAPPAWQGILNNSFHNLGNMQFEQGEYYQLEVVFNDPKEDYMLLNRQYKMQKLRLSGVRFDEMEWGMNVPEIPVIGDYYQLPEIPTIFEFGHQGGYTITDALSGLETMFNFQFWPPYYSKVCGATSCRNASLYEHVKLQLKFKVLGRDGRDYQLGDFTVSRFSSILPDYYKKVSSMPFVR